MTRLPAVLLTVFLLALPSLLSAKVETSRIVIHGADFETAITDPNVLKNFFVWSGQGTDPDQAPSFVIDWSQGPVAERPSGLARYQVSFYAKLQRDPKQPPQERLIYVVIYEYDPAARRGYIYLPGRGEEWHRLNTGTILRGVEGKWFRAWRVWDEAARPLIAGASE